MSRVADEFPPDIPEDSDVVSCRRVGQLAWLTIERPEVMNCLSFPTLKRFRMLLEELREDPALRCILITGAAGYIGHQLGNRLAKDHFVMGTDLHWREGLDFPLEENSGRPRQANRARLAQNRSD